LWLSGAARRIFLRYREKIRLQFTFSRYLSPDVVKIVMSDPSRLRLGGEKKHMTVLFTDIEKFSTLAEIIDDPEKLTEFLNYYLTGMSDILLENGGTIDKYEGDAIMGFFGAPLETEDHAIQACRTAILMKRREITLNAEIAEKGLSPRPIFTRIGINSGEMVVGNMGTERKMDYTVMGNAVNLASRLEGVNKQYFTGILISGSTRERIGDIFVLRRLDRVRVMGITAPVNLWELLDIREEAPPALIDMTVDWERAITAYEKQNYTEAKKIFSSIAGQNNRDKTAALYVGRCAEYMENPPPKDWDGVCTLTQK
jgi:adenylate cyclase